MGDLFQPRNTGKIGYGATANLHPKNPYAPKPYAAETNKFSVQLTPEQLAAQAAVRADADTSPWVEEKRATRRQLVRYGIAHAESIRRTGKNLYGEDVLARAPDLTDELAQWQSREDAQRSRRMGRKQTFLGGFDAMAGSSTLLGGG